MKAYCCSVIYAVLSDKIMMLIIGFIPFTRYVGEGARMVRELFQMARSKKACIVFFDEVRRRGHGGGDWGAGEAVVCVSLVIPFYQYGMGNYTRVCGDACVRMC